MKKLLCLLTAVLICALSIGALTAYAAGGVTLRLVPGSSSLRAGETVTISVSISGAKGAGNIVAAGPITLNFDGTKFSYVSASNGSLIGAQDFMAHASGSTVTLDYNDATAGSKPIKSDGQLFSVKLRVKDGVSSGSSVLGLSAAPASVANAGMQSVSVTTQGTTISFAKALSSNNKLRGITCANATLRPAFDEDVSYYSVDVPYTVNSLQLSALPADVEAKVSMSSLNLTPGETNNIKITVTAANGSKKVYTIEARCAADPNQTTTTEPSTTGETTTADGSSTTGTSSTAASTAPDGSPQTANSSLKNLIVAGYVLSPKFDPAKTDYVVWVPTETQEVLVSASSQNLKAIVTIDGGKDLGIGKNVITVDCKAEDGSETEYSVTVFRAPAHGQEGEGFDQNPDKKTSSEQPAQGGIRWWILVLVALVTFAAGVAGGIYIMPRMKNHRF